MRRIFLLLVCSVCLFSIAFAQPFEKQVQSGLLADKRLSETSGLAASRMKPGCFWMHNDSGDSARLFLVNKDGQTEGVVYFNEKVTDCEDIASGIGYGRAKSYVYLGDIGDNKGTRNNIAVYIFKEQELMDGLAQQHVYQYKKTILEYEDRSKDAEALMIDPIDSVLYIVSKRELNVHVYVASLKDVFQKEKVTLRLAATLPCAFITAGDISKDGSEVLLRNYGTIFYWKREGKEHLTQTFQRPAILIPYTQEKQGEAIGFADDNSGFYTTGEGEHAPLFFFKRK